MANNKMKKTIAKLAAAVLTAVLAVQAVMPVTEVQAATSTANKMLEIPVNFQTDRVFTEGLNVWGTDKAATYVMGYMDTENPLVFTCNGEDYTPDSRTEFKVYIPAEYFSNEDSMVICWMKTFVYDVGTVTDFLWSPEGVCIAVTPDGASVYDSIDDVIDLYSIEEYIKTYKDTDFEAQVKKNGEYYVLSVNSQTWAAGLDFYTGSGADEGTVEVYLEPRFYGFSMDVADGNIYLDDVKISTTSGKEIYSLDFEDLEEGLIAAVVCGSDGSGNKYGYTPSVKSVYISDTTVDTSSTTQDTTDTSEDTTGTTAEPSISATTATIAAGYTTKLSVTDGTVSSWKSSKKSVATVDKNGKVTGVKAGKATITATLDDGTKLSCKVTVKANKYTETKLTTSDVKSGKSDMQVYSAYYDDNGNLKIKVNVVNNTSSDFVKMKNIKIVVKNSAGKTIGTYTKSSKTVSIKSGSTKTMTFTVKKSALKKTSANMTKAEVTTCKATFK